MKGVYPVGRLGRRVPGKAMTVAGAKQLEELQVWQLASQLRDRLITAVMHSPAARDLDLKDQTFRAARSTAANIAEGFGHFESRQFAKYLRIARGSAMETKNYIHECTPFFAPQEAAELLELSRRTLAALAALIRYLESDKPPKKVV